MANEEKRSLAAVLVLSVIAYALAALLIIISRLEMLILSTVAPAAFTAIYLVISHSRSKKFRANKKKNKQQLPFIIFGLAVIPIIFSIILFIFYSYSVYLLILSFATELTFLSILFYLPLSIYDKFFWKNNAAGLAAANYKKFDAMIPLSIIIPAYNEEEIIERTIESVIESDYPTKQIIVVDDGSKDQTYLKASKYLRRFRADQFLVLTKPNGGKTSALNYGLCFATGEIIVVLDADSILSRNSLKELARQFLDPSVVAVASKVKNLRTTNTLQNCIALETVLGTNLLRGPFNVFGVIMIIPGAGGAFRRKLLLQSGGYDNDTITEDFDITLKLLKSSGRAIMVDAITYSDMPDNLKDLHKQRRRWNRGNVQTLLKHRNVLSNGRYGMLQSFGYPMLSMAFWFPAFLDFLIIGYTIYAILAGLWAYFVLPFVVYVLWQIVLTAIAVVLDGKDSGKVLLYSPLAIIGYKQILNFIIIKSVFSVLLFGRKKKLKWETTEEIPKAA